MYRSSRPWIPRTRLASSCNFGLAIVIDLLDLFSMLTLFHITFYILIHYIYLSQSSPPKSFSSLTARTSTSMPKKMHNKNPGSDTSGTVHFCKPCRRSDEGQIDQFCLIASPEALAQFLLAHNLTAQVQGAGESSDSDIPCGQCPPSTSSVVHVDDVTLPETTTTF